MAEFFHGVSYREIPTAVVPSANVNASLTMAFGTAPIHRVDSELIDKAMPGGMVLVYSSAEASKYLGINPAKDDFSKWGLSEVVFSHMHLYSASPIILVNLFNPNVHKKTITGEVVTFANDEGKLTKEDIITLTSLANTTSPATYVEGTDFMVNYAEGSLYVISETLGNAITAGNNITASYTYAAPEMVTGTDCIGGYDAVSGKNTGMELVEYVYSAFRMVPGILLAPNFSTDPAVCAVLYAKTVNINGIYNAIAIADIPSEGEGAVTNYTEVPAYKNNNGLTFNNLYLCWGKLRFGDRTMNMSTQVAGVLSQADASTGGLPYISPSNKNLKCQGAVVNGGELWLSMPQANMLNGNGIACPYNGPLGWVVWGNRTSCYPGITDPKDNFISNRRMLNWYGNRLILTYWQKVDFPVNRRLIQTMVTSENIYLNSLSNVGAIIDGRIEFLATENSTLDLMDGSITFHCYLGLVAPAERIEFLLEYDVGYLEQLFA